jgi:alpha/beta superfamily hydrolase
MGGTMTAPLLTALARELVGKGWAVLRFNFRGIGASEGESSTGLAEVADAEGAVDLVREETSGVPVAIAGWSFGAAVAVRVAANDPCLAACVAVAPAVKKKPGVTEGLPEPAAVSIDVPLLMICAANDDLVDVDDARRWAEGVPGARLEVLPGANHFFWAKYEPLAAKVGNFLDEHL